MEEQYVIIVAGGVGSRMNSDLPKQFIKIGGVPVIIRTILRFLEYNPGIHVIVSVHKDYQTYLEELLKAAGLGAYDIHITIGGNTRFASVKNGLDLITANNSVVGIHDAARPFVSLKTIKNCYETAALKGNAVPAVAVNESMRRVNNGGNNFVNRNEYRIIQTPQCFLGSEIKKAFQQNYDPAFTDDATVLEAIGEKIHLVEGNEENIKITSPNDLLIANVLLNQ